MREVHWRSTFHQASDDKEADCEWNTLPEEKLGNLQSLDLYYSMRTQMTNQRHLVFKWHVRIDSGVPPQAESC
eukprot:5931797-Amphidinium_carterae.1